MALGTVLPPMPSWPHSVPRWVATMTASTADLSRPLSTLRQRGGEGAGRHLLVALLEQLAHLDEPRPDDGDLVPAHAPPSFAARSCPEPTVARRRPRAGDPERLVAVHGDAPLERVAAQRQRDLVAHGQVGGVGGRALHHEPGAVLEVDDHQGQRRLEGRGHGLVDDEGLRPARAAPATRPRARSPPHPMQVGWIDGGVEIVPHVPAAGPEEPEHLGVAPDEGGPPGGQAHRDGVVHGLELAPGPQRLGVGDPPSRTEPVDGGAPRARRAPRRRPRPWPALRRSR